MNGFDTCIPMSASKNMASPSPPTDRHNNNVRRYKDRVTIVTGGASGIGYGIVKTFVQHGSNVVFCDIQEEASLKVQKEQEEAGPGECVFVKCDVSKEEDVKRLVSTTIARFGRLDCLVNNAGTHPPHMPIDDFSGEDLNWLHGINVMGYFLTSKHCLPHLRKSRGNIVNNSSLVASIGQEGAVTYATTKGGIVAMVKALAIDEAEHQVRVNSFSPGNIETPLWEEAAMATGEYEAAMQRGRDAQLLGRFGTVEECGLVCLFLAADATFCTGIEVNVSGGAELNLGFKNRTPPPSCCSSSSSLV